MTMRQLMSHTAGFDVSAGYDKINLADRDQPLQAMIDKLAKLPLASQPGTDWAYGPSVNIQGYIVEKLSGQTLDVFLRTQIFEPLGMKDTGFWVDPSKAGRVTRIYTYGPDKTHHDRATGSAIRRASRCSCRGSGGLLSTADDYWRFAQMLLERRAGERASASSRPSTVELMRTNVLEEGVKVDLYGPSQEGVGFGMDFAIVMDPAKAETPDRQEQLLLGRRLRHLVLDRPDQRHRRRRHDPEHQRQHADRRHAAGAPAVAEARRRRAGRSEEIGTLGWDLPRRHESTKSVLYRSSCFRVVVADHCL